MADDDWVTVAEGPDVAPEAPSGRGASGGWGEGSSSADGDDWVTIAEGPSNKAWDYGESIRQFGSGSVEGALGTLGLGADVLQSIVKGRPISFKQTAAFPDLAEPYLSERDPNYRYARTIGEFVGPQAEVGVVGKLGRAARARGVLGSIWEPAVGVLERQLAPRAVISATTAGAGSQYMRDENPDSPSAGIIGALIGGASPSVIEDSLRGIRSVFAPATAREVRGSAAAALRDATGLTEADIRAGIANTPQDDLGRLMSTAEVTRNPSAAQMERTLAVSDEPARLYGQRAERRGATRDAMLDQMSAVPAVNREALGEALITGATERSGALRDAAEELWRTVPRDVPIDVGRSQGTVARLLGGRQGGLPLDGRVRTLANQFLETGAEAPTGALSSGALQDIRSDALGTMRDANLTNTERRVLTALSSEIDTSMNRGLTGAAYDAWEQARGLTRTEREIFGRRGSAGAALTNEQARPAKALQSVFKGDTQSIEELREAVGADPALMERVRRGVLDTIPRNVQGEITPAGMRDFVRANEGALRELYGQQSFDAMNRIVEDLRSQAGVKDLADLAAKGGSSTTPRATVAGTIRDVLNKKMGSGLGPLAGPINKWRESLDQANIKRVELALYEAMMDPVRALDLAQAPTDVRVFNLIEQLTNATKNVAGHGGREVGVELMRPEPSEGQGKRESRGVSRAEAGLLGIAKSTGTPRPQGAEAPRPASRGTGPSPRAIPPPTPRTSADTSSPLSPISYRGDDMAPLSRAVQYVESRGNPNALSNKGAVGTHQVTAIAMRDILRSRGIDDKPYSDADLRQVAKMPGASREFGEAYLGGLLDKYGGDVRLALASYNFGPTAVDRKLRKVRGTTYDDIEAELPKETREYIPRVFKALAKAEA